MIPTTSAVALLLLLGAADGFRTRKRRAAKTSSGTAGTVAQLYTFGAPMVSDDVLLNPASSSGCFSGYRVIREETKSSVKVDAVVPVLTPLGFNHPKAKVLRLDTEKSDTIEPCGWTTSGGRRVDVGLHSGKNYSTMATRYCGAAASLALHMSYVENVATVAAEAKRQGWGLVDTALAPGKLSWLPIIGKNEVSHLFQNPSTLDCMITFEGTDSLGNWLDNLNVGKSSFCNLRTRTHSGFQEALRIITKSRDFQNKIRPQLPNCRNLWAIGHSLGGAIATLFSACANNYARAGSDGDFRNITWTRGTPKRMSYK
jgi:hypothetical protein